MADLDGRRIVVVGAAGALGGGVARACLAAGATVSGLDRHVPAAENQMTGVSYEAVDVLDDAALGSWFDNTEVPWAVLNVVGGFAGASSLRDLDVDELHEQLRLNLTSAALLTKHALRRMTTVGEGRIVHTSSRAAQSLEGVGFAYSVSKLAVLHLVSMAARETRGSAITVNAVVPSIIDTPANRAAMPGAAHDNWPKIGEVAEVFVFLASPRAALVSGAAVPVFGLV
ncbi:MAG TPA: SDR family oxidoreductase [Jatrophihabitantaceae bacterium]|nr:SDR family oxidoreductase [Jatrophihabitantaceae bacterium]